MMMSSVNEFAVYDCRSCGDYQLDSDEPTCCGESMVELEDPVPVEPPDEEVLMRTVFDISETELEVCRCLMSREEVTIEELTEAVDRDRSVVTRHLNHLVELGMVEKRSRVLSEGGRVNVYTHRSADVIRQQFMLGLYAWMTDAVDVIDDLSEEKLSLMVQRGTDSGSDQEQVVVDREESP